MSQDIYGKVRVRGKLVARTPISVGGMGAGDHVDLELAENGAGRLYIPGTSLAGPLRAWLEKSVDHAKSDNVVNGLFGFIADKGGDDGIASPLYIEDGVIDKKAVKERRHGIAIDEGSGTTKEGFFYTRALLPRGTSCPLEMELDIRGGIRDDKPHPAGALALIVEALQKGKIRFGACKTRGMGVMELQETEIDYYDFVGDAGALDQWLNGEKAAKRGLKALEIFDHDILNNNKRESVEATISWRAKSPMMVKSGRDGINADMMPLVSGVGGGVAPVIPGSSLKGILRSQANKILNTIFDPEFDPAEDNRWEWELVEWLFGSTERAGHLSVDDVYYRPEKPLDFAKWLEEDENTLDIDTVREQHVAIDRFTGGASDGALYNARPVKKDSGADSGWEPIHLTIDVSGLGDKEKAIVEALVKLLIRDMREGFVAIGFGSHRGMGEIEIVKSDDNFPSFEELQSHWNEFIGSGGKFPPTEEQEKNNG